MPQPKKPKARGLFKDQYGYWALEVPGQDPHAEPYFKNLRMRGGSRELAKSLAADMYRGRDLPACLKSTPKERARQADRNAAAAKAREVAKELCARDDWSGLSRAEFKALYAAQGRLCGICKHPPATSKATHLDHCHSTGRIRGVLCASCNKGLGHFRDDPALIRTAAHYLETADTGYVVPVKYTNTIPSSAPSVENDASRSSPLKSIGERIPGGQSGENR